MSFGINAQISTNTTASGNHSTAIQLESTASGDYSTAMGWSTTASGDYSTAMGRSTTVWKFNIYWSTYRKVQILLHMGRNNSNKQLLVITQTHLGLHVQLWVLLQLKSTYTATL